MKNKIYLILTFFILLLILFIVMYKSLVRVTGNNNLLNIMIDKNYKSSDCNSLKSKRPKKTLQKNTGKSNEVIYGITIDEDFSSIEEVVKAVKALSVKPTVRIVFEENIPAKNYTELISEIHKVAYILGCVYDSSSEKGVSLSQHHRRWVDYVTLFKDYVDIWEVGNEVNGEGWLGDDYKLLAAKFYDAYKYCKSLNLKTEITPYQFKPGYQSISMNAWLKKYIPNDMKLGLDYVMVSYYDDNNDGYKWNWEKVMKDLHKMFPNSKLGIGECGFPSPHKGGKVFNNRVDQYYKMPKFDDYYVGGYF